MSLRVGVRIYPNTQAGRDKVASLTEASDDVVVEEKKEPKAKKPKAK
jgi:hypothetical protein